MRLRIAANESFLESDADETITPVVALLSNMADALKWSLDHSEVNCGAYIPLPWITDILQCYEAALGSWRYDEPLSDIPLTGDKTVRPVFYLVLRLLQACLDHRLITGDGAAERFEQLLMLLEDPELPPLPADLIIGALAERQAASQIQDVPTVGPSDLYINCESNALVPGRRPGLCLVGHLCGRVSNAHGA